MKVQTSTSKHSRRFWPPWLRTLLDQDMLGGSYQSAKGKACCKHLLVQSMILCSVSVRHHTTIRLSCASKICSSEVWYRDDATCRHISWGNSFHKRWKLVPTPAHHNSHEWSCLSLHFLNAFQEGLLLAIFPEVAPGIETGSKWRW